MKRIIASLASLLAALTLCGAAAASEGGAPLDRFPKERVTDMAALQSGAKLFVNYCLNCHAAAFMRYNRLADIGLTDDQIKKNLLFATDKVGDLMTVSADPKQSKEWFGAVPPDLSVIARSRASGQGSGADYLYTYMRTFYRDETKATGWNNLAFPNVAMPHVLWELSGERKPLFDTKEEHGHKVQVFKGWQQVTPGSMTPLQYDQAMADLVGYMQWMAEPAQNTRVRVGVWVLLFLLMFTFIAWRLNASFWKDIK
jgi:ubiquinol-cytochrome c reductase cytochrome c1 subunit